MVVQKLDGSVLGKKAVFTFPLLFLIYERPNTSNYGPMLEELILKEIQFKEMLFVNWGKNVIAKQLY